MIVYFTYIWNFEKYGYFELWKIWFIFKFFWIMWSMIDFLNYEKHEIIMFVDHENNVYTKHDKMFSKKCVLENDFFVSIKH